MNEKLAKKVRKETRILYKKELRGYRSLPFWKRFKLACRVLFAAG